MFNQVIAIKKARIAIQSLVVLLSATTALLIGADTSSASTVRPAWNQSVCPANAWAPGDVHCWWATDPLDWVAFHVYFDPASGHDKAWANGYVGNASLYGFVCIENKNDAAQNLCEEESGGTRNGLQTPPITDGPNDDDMGVLDLFDSNGNRVAHYYTTDF